jgi:predicted nucleotidyltransferase
MEDLLDRLRNCAASLPAVRLAVLFGSTARGQARRHSDVDLGVSLHPGTTARRSEIEAALGRAAGRTVEVVYLEEAPPLLRFEISRDGMLLLEREDGLWTDFKAKAMVDWWDWAPTARRIEETTIQRLRDRVRRGQA